MGRAYGDYADSPLNEENRQAFNDALARRINDMLEQQQGNIAAPNADALALNRSVQESNLRSFNPNRNYGNTSIADEGKPMGRSNSFHGKNTADNGYGEDDTGNTLLEGLRAIFGLQEPSGGTYSTGFSAMLNALKARQAQTSFPSSGMGYGPDNMMVGEKRPQYDKYGNFIGYAMLE